MTVLWLKGCKIDFNDKSSVISNNKLPGNGGGIYDNDNVVLYSSVPVHLIQLHNMVVLFILLQI